MTLPVLYVSTLAVFLLVDAVMLTKFMKPLFERHAGHLMAESPRLEVALGFYLIYVGGILWFASWPALSSQDGARPAWGSAALNGAVLGVLAYGTYESVNMATLKGWSWQMVAADTAWGGALTALCAVAGLAITHAFGLGRV